MAHHGAAKAENFRQMLAVTVFPSQALTCVGSLSIQMAFSLLWVALDPQETKQLSSYKNQLNCLATIHSVTLTHNL